MSEKSRFPVYMVIFLLFMGAVFFGYGVDAIGVYSPWKEVVLEPVSGRVAYEKAGRSGNVVFQSSNGDVFKCWTGFCANSIVESCKGIDAKALVFNHRIYEINCAGREVLSRDHVESLGKNSLMLGYAFFVAFFCAVIAIAFNRRNKNVK